MESKGKLVPKNERILRAAEAVFSKKGYRQATLDEIVKSPIREREPFTNISIIRKIFFIRLSI